MTEHPPSLTGTPSLSLPVFDDPPAEPGPLMRAWLEAAEARKVREPRAATLATADPRGRASVRVLLVKEIDERGVVFTSSAGSRKGRELAATGWGALAFHWRETLQQLLVEGPVETLTSAESDTLFAQRPRSAQAATAVSQQSRILDDEALLRTRAERLLDDEDPIARPADWLGFRLIPHAVEFWCGSPDRVHRRLGYHRDRESDPWTHRRLQP